jgi:hypothetical protein
MMIIQTPGSFLFVYSLATRPGLNWTTWIVYFVTVCPASPPLEPLLPERKKKKKKLTCCLPSFPLFFPQGILQGALLVLCVCWKIRQQANGIDDWGRPLAGATGADKRAGHDGLLAVEGEEDRLGHSERTPLLPPALRPSTPLLPASSPSTIKQRVLKPDSPSNHHHAS